MGGYQTLIMVIVIILVIGLNLVVNKMNITVDLSSQKMFTLTSDTTNLVDKIKDKVTLYYMCQDGSEMTQIEKEGRGILLYMRQEGRGIGLMEKMKAYKLQEDGLDTVDANLHLGHQADERDYGVGAQILRHIGVTKMRLMSNNPVKRVGLEAYGLEVVENVPIEVKPNPYNEFYMKTKKERMGHVLHNIK